MEIYERIKKLRKTYLKLSQEAFGERLGVSRSVINNIERNCLARPDQKLSLIKLMCKEFSVNEDWLINGNEPIFVEASLSTIDDFAKSHGASEIEIEIIKTYFELDKEIREQIIQHFKSHLQKDVSPAPKHEMSVEDAEAAYKKSRLDIAKKTASSAFSTTSGTQSDHLTNIKSS